MSVVIEEKIEAVVRHDWTKEEIAEIYHRPLLELVFEASQVHNCLLYTSPSPRDRTRSRMPSSA